MKERIRQEAYRLGFDLCGFAEATPAATADFFRKWLSDGYYAGMQWLCRTADKRVNPLLVLPEAKTVIVVAVSYFIEDLKPSESITTAVIAKYARFYDYHIIIKERLQKLSEFILSNVPEGNRAICYVDTGPVLEREFAQKAGLGFIGKHSNLISRRFGNWLLLGEILTTLKIEPDASEKNRCGKCNLCIKACPTGAITAPFMVDSRLCISYLTIEHKGSIPVKLRPLIGNRLFGCDDCLDVCPWNRFATTGRIMSDYYNVKIKDIDILSLFSLDKSAFKKLFLGTPIERLGLQRLLRNAAVVLGNVGDEKALRILEKVETSSDALIAEHINWAIDRIKSRVSQRS